jgi:glyoxylase-like metal-dependent hydrolase (beta-lactamase superfamily II)/rhodanese-related sulfurtransferase
MFVKELNGSKCKAYVVACADTRKAILIDPEVSHVDRYIAWLSYNGYRLEAVVDTHTHADHLSASPLIHDLLDVPVIQHELAPSPRVDRHVRDGDRIRVGDVELSVLHTPGHTPDSLSLVGGGHVFTGDVLLIGGTGRADFAGGDAGEQYDSITGKLFNLPDETVVLPAHDYRGNTRSTIGREKRDNPRVAGRSRQEYIDLMASIEFPLPTRIQEVLQPNQSALDDDQVQFPTLAQLNEVRQLEPVQLRAMAAGRDAPAIIDVREEHEYHGELGHIPDSRLVPLKELHDRIDELGIDRHAPVVLVCRSGVRSTTGAAMLTGMGYENVFNLKGGMVAWKHQDA